LALILYVSTFGSDDPTRATLAFGDALGAIEAGHEAMIALAGEATYLMKDSVAAAVQGVGWPTVRELLEKVIEHKIPIYV
jgi:predicted peroxiredoxin